MAVDIDHADAAGTIRELDRRNSSDIYISEVEQLFDRFVFNDVVCYIRRKYSILRRKSLACE